jgi:hypothetical protein
MSLRHAYAPMFPEFDSFLFASVGEEVDGVPLSVLSALSRLDLDPRDEAARLSHLTKETAADQLARMIAGLSERRWTLSEARRVSGRLVERLPTSTGADKSDRFDTGAAPTPQPSQFLVYLAFLIALVVGLFANGLLSL